jgi:hypothetical protein
MIEANLAVKRTPHCKALLVFPRFAGSSFWNYRRTRELLGAKYPAAPLGLMTPAALLPHEWSVRCGSSIATSRS